MLTVRSYSQLNCLYACMYLIMNKILFKSRTAALAIDADGVCLDIFSPVFLSLFSPSLQEMARYRLKYCLKGLLNPKQPTMFGNRI